MPRTVQPHLGVRIGRAGGETRRGCEHPRGRRRQRPGGYPKDWPRTGSVEFRNVTIRYEPDGPDILKDISLKFEAGQRVAVIGRTGSGKSTLVLSLLRMTHIASGTILYGGVDITLLPRTRLRKP